MRIVFLHHANVCRGGIERMLCMKANMLVRQPGHEVMMLTYEQNGEPCPYELSPQVRCVDLGVRLYAAYRWPLPLRWVRKHQLCRQLSRAIAKCLGDFRPDVVVCTDKDAHEQMALVKARTAGRLIVEAHTGMIDHEMQKTETESLFRRLLASWDLRMLKKVVSGFDALIALTPDDARCWSPYVKTVCLPNALPCYPAPPVSHSVAFRRVIAVGRLNHQKGFDLLLQAWARVEARWPDWRLDIFGDGDDLDLLQKQKASLRLSTVTIHPGTEDIYAEYMKSDMLVCSSRWESFGLILIEAMSCTLPVVAFDCDSGPRNIIAHGVDGLLVRNGDIEALAEGVCRLIADERLRCQMGLQAYRSVARFKSEKVLSQYLDYYSSFQ